MVKFLSEEWIDISKKYILEKLDPEQDLKNITTSLLNVVEHVPPNDTSMNFYLGFQDGKLTDFIVNTGDTFEEKEAIFIIRGNYGTFKGILKGEMSMAVALLKNRLKLKGSKMKALKLIKPLDGVIASLREITDEYEE
ncbi:MAG: SCP2 sterol-binding domain-containing protein [Thermoplasmatales archaeon]|nr:MAG: SCP2 sterol-binding domain-containing protein [Thermoplasmatales archaeon]